MLVGSVILTNNTLHSILQDEVIISSIKHLVKVNGTHFNKLFGVSVHAHNNSNDYYLLQDGR